MNETIELNNIKFEEIEKLVNDFEDKYSFDTNHFVDFIYYGVDKNVLGKSPKKYTIILREKNSYKIILTNNINIYNELYIKYFKKYMED